MRPHPTTVQPQDGRVRGLVTQDFVEQVVRGGPQRPRESNAAALRRTARQRGPEPIAELERELGLEPRDAPQHAPGAEPLGGASADGRFAVGHTQPPAHGMICATMWLLTSEAR